MTQYEITNVTINSKSREILIEATDMDAIFLAEDLDAEFAAPTARFRFDGLVNDGAQLKYLYKVAAGQKKCRGKKSLAATFKALEGCFVFINEKFRVTE